jgi:hypothetical protein
MSEMPIWAMSVIGILGEIRDDPAAEKTQPKNQPNSSGDEGSVALR